MLLLLDVGNSQTVVACCDPVDESFQLIWYFSTNRDLTAGEWLSLITVQAQSDSLDTHLITDIIISSVVPSVTIELTTMFESWLGIEPLLVSADLKLGIELAVENPREVGADRLCNAVAAFHCAQHAAFVVDAGTATKVEAVSRDGVFVGGAIAPGIGVSLEALVSRAAQLYSVQLKFPESVIGANTVEAMQSGLVVGHLASIEGLVHRFRQQLGENATVILTGGYGPLFWQRSNVFDLHEPELTLRGLLRIWKLNQ